MSKLLHEFFICFISVNLLILQSAQAQTPGDLGLFNVIEGQNLYKETNLPKKFEYKNQLSVLFEHIKDKDFKNKMQSNLEKIPNNAKFDFSLEWLPQGFKISEVEVNLVKKVVKHHGKIFSYEMSPKGFEKLEKFLSTPDFKSTFFSLLIPEAHAIALEMAIAVFVLAMTVVGVIAAIGAFFTARSADKCLEKVANFTKTIEDLNENCRRDLEALQSGVARNRLETQKHLDEVKSRVFGTKTQGASTCEEEIINTFKYWDGFWRPSCLNTDYARVPSAARKYPQRICQSLQPLRNCLSDFEDFDPTRINDNARDGRVRRYREPPVGGYVIPR